MNTVSNNNQQQGDNTVTEEQEAKLPLPDPNDKTHDPLRLRKSEPFAIELGDPTPHLRSAPTTFAKEEENKGKKDKDGNDIDLSLRRVVSMNHDAAFG
jgi:hypothetical protein